MDKAQYCQQANDRNQQETRYPVKRDRTANVSAIGSRPAAFPHHRIFDDLTAVTSRSGKFKTKRAGECGFRPSGVGRAVAAGIIPDCAQGTARRQPGCQQSCDDDQTGGQTRCGKVDQIVESGGRAAEIDMSFRFVTNHAVRGVDGLVGGDTGQPAKHQPEHRCNHAVGKVFGQALDRGATDTGFVQRFSVASDNLADGNAAAIEPVPLQSLDNCCDMVCKTALGDQACRQQRDDKPAKGKQAGKPLGKQSAAGRREYDDEECDNPGSASFCRRFVGAIEFVIENIDQIADPDNRMANGFYQQLGVSEDQFGDERQKRDDGRHGA